jgi:lipopolysaccharide transport system ATP-binding protein
MGRPIIEIHNLGKQYRLGVMGARTLREDLERLWRNLLSGGKDAAGKKDKGFVWALRNFSLDIHPGETIGFVGGNGAGKSTLLKLLSRITEPTEGRATIRGKVAALLEVGSGFHNELTGRENTFLNAAILGMSRATTKQKLDQIIEFSGVEPFIDTPVKRYSSGMRVRLAFAIAAFLEPDILIADEVLAVGDASFQKKSLGKMGDVAREGRTVLFVSHDLAAVQHLCQRVVVLKNGRLVVDDRPVEAIGRYLSDIRNGGSEGRHSDRAKEGPHLANCSVSQGAEAAKGILMPGKPIDFSFLIREVEMGYHYVVEIHSESGVLVSRFSTRQAPLKIRGGDVLLRCSMDRLLLSPGRYRVGFSIYYHDQELDYEENATSFEVTPANVDLQRVWSQRTNGLVYLPHQWSIEPVSASVAVRA